mmetsp:Transcript_35533/g.69969  ORF Transcript_35533/g.69969 Transcript_35533/m.69969 type:complete len:229 (-) Transcript_35533:976-1662(-)
MCILIFSSSHFSRSSASEIFSQVPFVNTLANIVLYICLFDLWHSLLIAFGSFLQFLFPSLTRFCICSFLLVSRFASPMHRRSSVISATRCMNATCWWSKIAESTHPLFLLRGTFHVHVPPASRTRPNHMRAMGSFHPTRAPMPFHEVSEEGINRCPSDGSAFFSDLRPASNLFARSESSVVRRYSWTQSSGVFFRMYPSNVPSMDVTKISFSWRPGAPCLSGIGWPEV